MKKLLVSGAFLVFLGLILSSAIVYTSILSIYFSLAISIFLAYDVFRQNKTNSVESIIEKYKKDNIEEQDILDYSYMEYSLILGYLFPLVFATYEIQLIALIYLLTYIYFVGKNIVKLRKHFLN